MAVGECYFFDSHNLKHSIFKGLVGFSSFSGLTLTVEILYRKVELLNLNDTCVQYTRCIVRWSGVWNFYLGIWACNIEIGLFFYLIWAISAYTYSI